MTRITAGILTFNRREAVLKAIRSAYDQAGSFELEVVVVDSNSQDDTAEAVREQFPDAKLIRLPENLGCPGGRNHVMANCTGDYIVNIDDDGYLGEGALARVIEVFDADPTLGVIAMRQCFTDDPESAERDLPLWKEKDLGQFNGGVSAFRRSMLAETGLYPPDFFLYGEEAHLALRVLDAGYGIRSVPDIVMWHPRIGTSGADGSKWDFYRARNNLRVVTELFPGSMMVQHLLLRLLSYGRWAVVHRTPWAYIRAVSSVLFSLPSTLAHRKPCKPETVRRYLAGRQVRPDR